MPFRHLEPGRFDLDTLKLMQQAFDKVCAKLQIDENDPRRAKLAFELIRLADEGTLAELVQAAEEALARAGQQSKLATRWRNRPVKNLDSV